MSLDELPQLWWQVAEDEADGYQYRTVVRVLGKNVETGPPAVSTTLTIETWMAWMTYMAWNAWMAWNA